MKILVAEAQDSFRKVLVSSLEERKLFVLQASQRAEMDELLKQNVDLLVVDTAFLSAKVAVDLKAIVESYPNLSIIITSAATSPESTQKCMDALVNGAVDYLPNPFSIEKLEEALQKAVSVEHAVKREEEFGGRNYISLDLLPSIHKHPLMKKAYGLLQNVADSNITILLSGPSGAGKEIFARTIHMRSKRSRHHFVGLNCASVPDSLLEVELFGSEKGAYTGSVGQRMGKFELAQKGTLLLDEISEMDVGLQSKLLRVIQEREMYRIGGEKSVPLDVRLIATTNRDLYDWVKKGHFREDLFYRLNVISIEVPPLSERLEDVPVLAQYLLERFAREHKQRLLSLSIEATEQLCRYNWPGNIRELENVLIRTSFMTAGPVITKISFDDRKPEASRPGLAASEPLKTLDQMEYEMIRKALEQHHGNRTHAASSLGISVRTLRNKLQTYPELDEQVPAPASGDGSNNINLQR